MTRLTILFATLLLQAAVSQSTRASIEGMVRDVTGRPVAHGSLELTVVEGPRVLSWTATSAEDGRFLFKDLPPGEGYQLVVTGTRLWPTAYGQERSFSPWTPLTLAPGQHLTDVRITAHAITEISGTVLDSLGKAQVGASVFALAPTYADGRRELRRAGNTLTNLRGEYRFTNLNPGRYYIRVSPRNEAATDPVFQNPALRDRSPSGRPNSVTETEGYPTVYYPGVPLESAKAIVLEDSQALAGLDFTVTKSRTSRVRGTVTNDATGKKIAALITLLPMGVSPDSNWGRFFDSKDGNFDLRAVLPGMYFLSATAMTPDRPLAGRVAVEVRSGDTPVFDVHVAPATDISGRIVVDDREATTPNFSTVSVNLTANTAGPVDGTLSRSRTSLPSASALRVKTDGTFTLPGVMPWDYRVSLSGIPGAYVKAVRYGNMDALANGLRVDGTSGQAMEIILATDGGRLDGRILDASRARVVLVPEARQRRDLYFAVSLSSTGRFQIVDIPPGRYKLFAWQNPAEGAWTDPDYLGRYENRGTPVEIQSESSEYIEIKVIPNF